MTPNYRSLIIGAILLFLALIGDMIPYFQASVIALAGLYCLALVLDAIWVITLPKLSIERIMDTSIPVREWVPVQLKIQGIKGPCQKFILHDLYDDIFESKDLPQNVSLKSNETTSVKYSIKANQRGSHYLQGVQYLLRSPLSLWDLKRTIPLVQGIKVQPNYKSVIDLALLGSENQRNRMGIRQQRRRGEGTEFHQLREFQNGDPMRKIDWKASSRIGKLVSKEFQDEQDQQLIFLLDTGRRMRHQDTHSNFLDDTLNAMLLLGHLATKQGDAVGFMAFGHDNTWCAPRKHKAVVKHLVDHCFDIQSGLAHSDYLQSAQRILELQKRRALIIILTNTRDEDKEELEKAVLILRKRHLVVIADLQEPFLKDHEQTEINNFSSASTYLAMQEYLNIRKEMQQALTGLGALYLDCPPKDLPTNLVATYQQIKHSGRL